MICYETWPFLQDKNKVLAKRQITFEKGTHGVLLSEKLEGGRGTSSIPFLEGEKGGACRKIGNS